MRTGSLLALVALLLLGGAGGYAAAQGLRSDPAQLGTPHPLLADEAPEMPAPDPLPDSSIPPLDGTIELTRARIYNGKTAATLLVPAGWDRVDMADGSGTRFSLPDHPDGAYSLRVKRLDGTVAPWSKVLFRERSLPGDPAIDQLTILSDTSKPTGTISFEYVKDGYLKRNIVRFASYPGSSFADVEIAWTGRVMDEAGMRTLVVRMAESIRPAE